VQHRGHVTQHTPAAAAAAAAAAARNVQNHVNVVIADMTAASALCGSRLWCRAALCDSADHHAPHVMHFVLSCILRVSRLSTIDSQRLKKSETTHVCVYLL
jgi:hypothetical protein